MIRVTGSVRALALLAATAAPLACTSGPATPIVRHATYTYTCCATADVDTVRHPGDTFSVHWIVSEGSPTASDSASTVTLTAELNGPFADVTSLKAAPTSRLTLKAEPLVTTDRAGGEPVSTISIPADARPGFYNLAFSMESSGGRVSGASIVRIALEQ